MARILAVEVLDRLLVGPLHLLGERVEREAPLPLGAVEGDLDRSCAGQPRPGRCQGEDVPRVAPVQEPAVQSVAQDRVDRREDRLLRLGDDVQHHVRGFAQHRPVAGAVGDPQVEPAVGELRDEVDVALGQHDGAAARVSGPAARGDQSGGRGEQHGGQGGGGRRDGAPAVCQDAHGPASLPRR
ncbi:hypothetical protein AB6O49_32135 [Streptomyces sp. SBR177]